MVALQVLLSLCVAISPIAAQNVLAFPKVGMAQLPSSKAGKPSNIYIRLVLTGKNITLTMSGPSNKWFGVGFGQSMYLTEAVIFSKGKTGKDPAMARTYRLMDESSDGVVLNKNQVWVTVSQKKTLRRINVTVTREMFIDASGIQEFDMDETMINMIWARGPGMTLVEHEQKQRPIHLDMIKGTAMIGGTADILSYPSAGISELPSSNPNELSQIFMRLEFDAAAKNATMILMGPIGKWFGVGFGTSMYLTEAVIFSTGKNGTDVPMARTYHLSHESSSGVQLNPKQIWSTKYQSQANGMQIVTLIRPLFVDASNVTEFDMGETLLNVIWARGKSLKLVEHVQKDRPLHLQMTPMKN